tara:strand:+ start:1591 stop:2562 length:972 start_codon:yes stop_codon:yes gene_type:complete
MKASYITQAVLVILVFVGVLMANMASAGVDRIKNNWPEYRCNPAVMPFAATFGHDPVTNFSECISGMMSSAGSLLTAPFSQNLSVFTGAPSFGSSAPTGGLGGSLTGSVGASRGMFANVRANLATITQSVFGIFLNLMIEVQKLFINLKDLISKLLGAIATVVYFVETATKGLSAVWEGPPGGLMRGLCFAPCTKVRLVDGSRARMDGLKPGATLKSGAEVCAVMEIGNTRGDGQPLEAMYTLPGGEDDEDVVVSGSHLVYDPAVKDYVAVRELCPVKTGAKLAQAPYPTLYCLITSDHTIPLGSWVFHDWEDNNGSKSKDIA